MDDAIDTAQNADPRHRAAAFLFAVLGADRVTVQTLNALGEYDIATFSPAEVILAVNTDEIERLRAALEAHSIVERDCPIDGRKTFQIQPALDGDFYCPDCCQWIES